MKSTLSEHDQHTLCNGNVHLEDDDSFKHTPMAILSSLTVILIQRTINTSREYQKHVGQHQKSLSQASYQFSIKKNINSS